MSFDLEAAQLPKHWYAQSPALSHFFNALSAVFPDGEKFFIDSVRAYEDMIADPALKSQIREFCRQEGHHTLHHRLFNQRLQALGVSMERCADIAKEILSRSRAHDTPMMQLATTVAFEHFTAMMGDWLLRQSQPCGDMHPSAHPPLGLARCRRDRAQSRRVRCLQRGRRRLLDADPRHAARDSHLHPAHPSDAVHPAR